MTSEWVCGLFPSLMECKLNHDSQCCQGWKASYQIYDSGHRNNRHITASCRVWHNSKFLPSSPSSIFPLVRFRVTLYEILSKSWQNSIRLIYMIKHVLHVRLCASDATPLINDCHICSNAMRCEWQAFSSFTLSCHQINSMNIVLIS